MLPPNSREATQLRSLLTLKRHHQERQRAAAAQRSEIQPAEDLPHASDSRQTTPEAPSLDRVAGFVFGKRREAKVLVDRLNANGGALQDTCEKDVVLARLAQVVDHYQQSLGVQRGLAWSKMSPVLRANVDAYQAAHRNSEEQAVARAMAGHLRGSVGDIHALLNYEYCRRDLIAQGRPEAAEAARQAFSHLLLESAEGLPDVPALLARQLPPGPNTVEMGELAERARALERLAGDFVAHADELEEAQQELCESATHANEVCMKDLAEWLPMLLPADPAQRSRITNLLTTLGDRLNRFPDLSGDQPLPAVEMVALLMTANQVARDNPEEVIDILQTLTTRTVAEVMGHALKRRGMEVVATGEETSDAIDRFWMAVAEATPGVQESALRVMDPSPAGERRTPKNGEFHDVQMFWRMAREIRPTLAAQGGQGPAAGPTGHQAWLQDAMQAIQLRREGLTVLTERQMLHSQLVRTTLWKEEHLQTVESLLSELREHPEHFLAGRLPEMVDGRAERKGRDFSKAAVKQGYDDVIARLRQVQNACSGGATATAGERLLGAVLHFLHDPALQPPTPASCLPIDLNRRRRQAVPSEALAWDQRISKEQLKVLGDRLQGTPAESFCEVLADIQQDTTPVALLSQMINAHGKLPEGQRLSALDALQMPDLERLATFASAWQPGVAGTPAHAPALLKSMIMGTELGDRMDLVNHRGIKVELGAGGVIGGPASLAMRAGFAAHGGYILNVQCNNDCIQLTIGVSGKGSYGIGASVGAGFDAGAAGRAGPRVGLMREAEIREDPAIVLKCPIDPRFGMRNLDQARQELCAVVDRLFESRPPDDTQSPAPMLEQLMRLEKPPIIDVEVRTYGSVAWEGSTATGLSVSEVRRATDNAVGLGASAQLAVTRGKTVMQSSNQQGAAERYFTRKAELSLGVNMTLPVLAFGEHEDKGRRWNMLSGVSAGWNASAVLSSHEFKAKRPVGSDRQVAIKDELGTYSGNTQVAAELLEAALPQIARRVQDVLKDVDKYLGMPEGQALSGDQKQRLHTAVLADVRRRMRDVGIDRFSTKLESNQMWLHRQLLAAKESALAGDFTGQGAQALSALYDEVLLSDGSDMATKYFVAATESAVKETFLSWNRRPVVTRAVKTMGETAIPETTTQVLDTVIKAIQSHALPSNVLATGPAVLVRTPEAATGALAYQLSQKASHTRLQAKAEKQLKVLQAQEVLQASKQSDRQQRLVELRKSYAAVVDDRQSVRPDRPVPPGWIPNPAAHTAADRAHKRVLDHRFRKSADAKRLDIAKQIEALEGKLARMPALRKQIELLQAEIDACRRVIRNADDRMGELRSAQASPDAASSAAPVAERMTDLPTVFRLPRLVD